MNIRKHIRRWYEGIYVPPDNPPDSPVFMVMGHYDRHWTSRLVRTAISFYLREWKWVWTFAVAVIGAIAAFAKLK
jgi:hypothetical protein